MDPGSRSACGGCLSGMTSLLNMPAKSLMIQGTSSHAGKSILTTAFCRYFFKEGFRTAPFKSQNMSLNSMVTVNGEEIAVAQAVQAEAAGIDYEVEMNPILLKPTGDSRSQVIVMGRPVDSMDALNYERYKDQALSVVTQAYQKLASNNDVIVIEGAGSPVEMNLKDRDIVNMKMAEIADAPVIIVTDIDRGGVMASLVGTMELLEPHERDRVVGFVINKFRGERKLLDSALEYIEKKTNKPVLGVIPFLRDLKVLSEDSVSLEDPGMERGKGSVRIAAVLLPHMSNFTDFAPLELESEINFKFAAHPDELENQEMIIIPGSKNTIQDMKYLWKSGLASKIRSLKGKSIIFGICGGFQMLGREIRDPYQIESTDESVEGLGLTDAVTVIEREKRTVRVEAKACGNSELFDKDTVYSGYEIHMGKTSFHSDYAALFRINDQDEGIVAENGKILGTYLHGLFDNDLFRKKIIQTMGHSRGSSTVSSFTEIKTKEYDRLRDVITQEFRMDLILKAMKMEPSKVK